jgi:hypothetical protein
MIIPIHGIKKLGRNNVTIKETGESLREKNDLVRRDCIYI